MIQVFSSGGGTQSTAISALIVQGRLPKPDFVVIADTGREMPTTWEYLESVTKPELLKVGVLVHKVGQEFCSDAAKDYFSTSDKGTLLVPAYSDKGGIPSKLPVMCSNEWKVRVIDRWLSRRYGITRSKYCKWIGFSFDETNRIHKMMQGELFSKGLIRFPLVQDVPTRRHEAIRIVEKMGWPKPPRSRCWMCPNQSDLEWSEVKSDYPELFCAAISLDERIRERDPNAYLHSTIKPLKEADLSKPDDLFSGSCPSGECFL